MNIRCTNAQVSAPYLNLLISSFAIQLLKNLVHPSLNKILGTEGKCMKILSIIFVAG